MIIDAHTHLGISYNAWWKNEISEDEFILTMDEWKIDKSCVSYFGINYNPEEGNDIVANFINKYPNRLIGFACVSPLMYKTAVNEVIRAKNDLGMKGIKLHPFANNYYSDSPIVFPVIEKAIELDLPLLFHSGSDEFSHPRNLANLAKLYPEAKIIMAHMGGNSYFEAIHVASVNKNIILDTAESCNFYGIINYAIDFVGEDRIVFGSDFPSTNMGPELSKIKDANITKIQKEKILGLNMKRTLKL